MGKLVTRQAPTAEPAHNGDNTVLSNNNVKNMSEQYPLEASLWGTNTVYLACEHRGCRQNYAICCNILKATREGRRRKDDACTAEISRGVCPAMAMRAEEEEAGHALYYIPRAPAPAAVKKESEFESFSGKIDRYGHTRGWDHAGSVIKGEKVKSPVKQPVAVKPKPAATSAPADFGSVLSQAVMDINVAKKAAKETQRPVVTATQQPEPSPKPKPAAPKPKNETVLERARRLAKERQVNHV